MTRKNLINKKGQKAIMVFCQKCRHWFVDSVDWEKAKSPKFDTAFVVHIVLIVYG